ncbi:hypothetical protein IU485_27895 [Nocardia cyriacigeorgica]|uniref:hypothetical protein n=1 Tax=Nocardia cyriacigeorgica TaxID=135487 RepID=UPI0018932D1C|nr:hypothetical protein [Nocardia cyriacigeorgica]MBF6085201.1 hypothetical protein [Nocardia cyriacigeorgica]
MARASLKIEVGTTVTVECPRSRYMPEEFTGTVVYIEPGKDGAIFVDCGGAPVGEHPLGRRMYGIHGTKGIVGVVRATDESRAAARELEARFREFITERERTEADREAQRSV